MNRWEAAFVVGLISFLLLGFLLDNMRWGVTAGVVGFSIAWGVDWFTDRGRA